jgi:hypothetical protein
MIIPLLQSTNHNNRNHRLTPLDIDWYSATMNCVLACMHSETILLGEQVFVARELVVHGPGAAAVADDSLAFAGDPEVIVELGAG